MVCLFCKIIKGQIKADIVYEDPDILAFKDINPQAPVHLLVVPKKHIDTIDDIGSLSGEEIRSLFKSIPEIALKAGLKNSGYRSVINCRKDAGQEVFHLHIHLLGGRKFSWPPG